MALTITEAFIRQYEEEVHLAYQRRGSKLRGLVRTKNGVKGESTTFQIIGTGTAGQKARHGLVPVSDNTHSNVTATLADWYEGNWVDKLDEFKINIDERRALADSGAWALGRKTDDIIIGALDDATNSTTLTATGTARQFLNSVVNAHEDLLERDVPDDGQIYAVISLRTESWLMLVPEYNDADFVSADKLPFNIGRARGMKSWMGVMWMTHTGLPLSGNNRTNLMFHRTAAGHAIGAEIYVDVTWHGDRQSHFIAHGMSMGAVLIDNNGVQEMVLDESQTLPTS